MVPVRDEGKVVGGVITARPDPATAAPVTTNPPPRA